MDYIVYADVESTKEIHIKRFILQRRINMVKAIQKILE